MCILHFCYIYEIPVRKCRINLTLKDIYSIINTLKHRKLWLVVRFLYILFSVEIEKINYFFQKNQEIKIKKIKRKGEKNEWKKK